jgi:hypothetical protein
MKLTKFKLVNHEGMTGLNYNGRTIAFDKLTDEQAEKLFTKTHVLERLPGTEPATTPVVLALAEAAPEAGAEAEVPATTSRRAR